MTCDLIARIAESNLNKINLNTGEGLERYNYSITILEEYMTRNFLTFDVSELVYKHARFLADYRTAFEKWYRSIGWIYNPKFEAFKQSPFNRGHVNHRVVKPK